MPVLYRNGRFLEEIACPPTLRCRKRLLLSHESTGQNVGILGTTQSGIDAVGRKHFVSCCRTEVEYSSLVDKKWSIGATPVRIATALMNIPAFYGENGHLTPTITVNFGSQQAKPDPSPFSGTMASVVGIDSLRWCAHQKYA